MGSRENSQNFNQMDDPTALRILHRLANADPDYNEVTEIFGNLVLPPLPASRQAEICKETLHALKELSPERGPVIEKLSQEKSGQQFFEPASAIWLACIVVLLRSHIKYHKKSDGAWEFKVEYQPADSKFIIDFLKKISSFLPGSGAE